MCDINESGGYFDLDKLKEEILELEQKTMEEGFFGDKKGAEKIYSEINHRKYWIEKVEKIDELIDEVNILLEMVTEDDSTETRSELQQTYTTLTTQIDEIEMRSMLSKPEDKKNAFFTIHAGQGGTEAQDWAEMLMRMFTRYFSSRGFKFSTVDYLAGDKFGVKTVTFEVKGEFAFGFLKSEIGVHRLIRISPFDSQHKRHTSFASVFVAPEVDDIEVEIDAKDLRIDTYRASGAGGQHVNKTDSAVRITHIPTGVVAQSQAQRSQVANKEFAMNMLKARLYQKKLEEEKLKLSKIEDSKKEISWGSQIRTYTFHPYNLVKDHRTNVQIGNTGSVMDGNLEKFIKAYLIMFSSIG